MNLALVASVIYISIFFFVSWPIALPFVTLFLGLDYYLVKQFSEAYEVEKKVNEGLLILRVSKANDQNIQLNRFSWGELISLRYGGYEYVAEGEGGLYRIDSHQYSSEVTIYLVRFEMSSDQKNFYVVTDGKNNTVYKFKA